MSKVLFAESRTIFSLSTNDGQIAGKIFVAQSSSEKTSAVAASARSAAFLACTNGSLRDLEKAATSTFDRVLSLVSC